MFVVSRTETMTVNHTWDEILTWTHCVGYVLHQFSYASPVCKDSPMVCMKTTWRSYGVCWNVGFEACLWTCSDVIPCLAPLGSEISSHRFWLLKGKILDCPSGEATVHRRHPDGGFPASPRLPLGQSLPASRLLKYQIPKLAADKEHFYLLQKSSRRDSIYKMQSNGK